MSESQEQLNHNKPDVFFDWYPYQGDKIKEYLNSLGINYREPKINGDLREKIEDYLDRKKGLGEELNEKQIFVVGTCLRFLEMGMMIDGFGKNEEERHKFLLGNQVKINNKEMSLYDLSKRVSRQG